MDCVVCPLVHANVYGPVPPLGFAVRVAGAFAHTDVGPLIDAVGIGLTVNVAVLSAVPAAFVKCARYRLPFAPVDVLYDVDVSPTMLLYAFPPSVETCHCTAGMGKP